MNHMQALMTKKLEWLEVDGPMGTEWVALEDVGATDAREFTRTVRRAFLDSGSRAARVKIPSTISDFFENHEVYDAAIVKGYGVRSSAPGYMDATPWSVYRSLREAQRAYATEKRAIRGED